MSAVKETEDAIVQYENETNGFFSIVKRVVKNFIAVSAIYLVGHLDLSVAWLIAPVVLEAFRSEWKINKNRQRKAIRAAVQNEKKVILASIGELPSWVYFPDFDRVEWMNKMLVQLWPKINVYAEDIIKTTVEPKIQETLDMYKMSGFQFAKLRLGTMPPRIGGIKVYDKITRNEIIMDLDLIYAGDCDISFYLKGLSGGIKDFQIHGMMRIIMKPLIPVIPFIGGLQVFFLNKPSIDFNLVGAADILDIPGISDVLRKVIVEQISNMMVLPNKLPIVLSETVPAEIIKIPEPEGVLRIQVVQAIKLMKKDVGVLGKGKSDPYVIVTMGAQEFRSQTINNTVNPKWDFWCEFALYQHSDQKLMLNVYDKDDASKTDDFLGRAAMKLVHVMENGEVDTWISLEDVKHGMVHLRLMWYNLSTDAEDLKPAWEELKNLKVTSINSAVLIVYVDSVQHLPDAKADKRPDPIVTISCGHEMRSTGVQFRTNNPVYEQAFCFLINNPKTETMALKVTDQKTGIELGWVLYSIAQLIEKEGMKHDIEPVPLHKTGGKAKVMLATQLKILKKPEVKPSNSSTTEPTSVSPPSTPSTTATEVLQPDVITDSKSVDETSKDVKSLTNEDSFSNDLQSFSSNSGTDNLNMDAFKSEEVSNSCQWIGEQFEAPKQNSVMSSIKSSLRRRQLSQTDSIKNFGSVEITLDFIPARPKLVITVHRITDLPCKDPTDLPDPYVKLYLLPKSKENKRKTKVIKDSCNPVYEEKFEYVMSKEEIPHRQLRVLVTSQKTTFISKNSIMGQVTLDLKDLNLDNNKAWYNLEPDQD